MTSSDSYTWKYSSSSATPSIRKVKITYKIKTDSEWFISLIGNFIMNHMDTNKGLQLNFTQFCDACISMQLIIIIILGAIIRVSTQLCLVLKLVILIVLLYLVIEILIAQSLGAWHRVVPIMGRMLFANAVFAHGLDIPLCPVYLFVMEILPTMVLLVKLTVLGKKIVSIQWKKQALIRILLVKTFPIHQQALIQKKTKGGGWLSFSQYYCLLEYTPAQHVKHAESRGVWGHAPTENF